MSSAGWEKTIPTSALACIEQISAYGTHGSMLGGSCTRARRDSQIDHSAKNSRDDTLCCRRNRDRHFTFVVAQELQDHLTEGGIITLASESFLFSFQDPIQPRAAVVFVHERPHE